MWKLYPVLFVSAMLCSAESLPELRFHAPGSVMLPGEKIVATLTPGGRTFHWSILDWQGKTLRNGTARGEFSLPETLLPGYYSLEISSAGKTLRKNFGILPSGKISGSPEMPYCVDFASAIGTVPRYDPNDLRRSLKFFADLCAKAGIRMVRERFWWSASAENPGEYHWGRTLPLAAELFAERGIKISCTFHNAPKHEREWGGSLPNSPLSVYRFGKAAAEKFRNQIQVWEFWNEQELNCTELSRDAVWNFAAMFKAFVLGARSVDPSLRFTPGSFATIGKDTPYIECLMKNELSGYTDIFNIHLYAPCDRYPVLMEEAGKWMNSGGMGRAEIWVTENGTNAEGKAVSAPAEAVPGVFAHSPDQELLQAEFMVKAQLKLQALGARRTFAFVLPPYNERGGTKDWGFLRRDYSAKPVYFAFASLIHSLGNAELLGTWEAGPGAEALLFRQKDGSLSLVCWSDSNVDREEASSREITLRIPSRCELRGSNLFGTPFVLPTDGSHVSVRINRYPVYLHGLAALKPAVPAPVRKTVTNVTGKDLSVIVALHPLEHCELSGTNTALQIHPDHGRCRVLLRVANLSPERKSGSIDSSGVLRGLPEIIELPPFSQVDFTAEIQPEERDFSALVLRGVFNGKEMSGITIPIARLDRPGIVLPVWEINRWKKNSAGKNMTFTPDEKQQIMTIDASFNPQRDKWVYPEFSFDRESLRGAAGIAFELRANRKLTANFMLAMFSEKPLGEYLGLTYAPPSTQWRDNFIPLHQLDAGKFRFLRIGMNPREDSVSYSIRNLRIIPGE